MSIYGDLGGSRRHTTSGLIAEVAAQARELGFKDGDEIAFIEPQRASQAVLNVCGCETKRSAARTYGFAGYFERLSAEPSCLQPQAAQTSPY